MSTPAYRRQLPWLIALITSLTPFARVLANDYPLRVGSAAVNLQADDTMVIGGGIGPGKAVGQEGQLRCVAVVVGDSKTRLAIVACDILMMNRDVLDAACEQIAQATGIPTTNVLINCTHTHHAPTTVTVHGYTRDPVFTKRVQEGIVSAVKSADANAKQSESTRLEYRLGEESSVGQNSRLLLSDGMIYWTGPRDDAVRPTGPFDPDLPVLAFRRADRRLAGLIFNHSTHTIGALTPGKRSPSFYGMAAQELERELGGTVLFLEGASGSTHNLTLRAPEMTYRIKRAVHQANSLARVTRSTPLRSLKVEFPFRVRLFDELEEDATVRKYCGRRYSDPKIADLVAGVFRDMRRELAASQGQTRKTWLHALRIGDVAIVGVPAEFFTVLGQDIKRRSPFRNTVVAELANDWIGYVPDRRGFELGGYQTWTGFHSYCAPGTGEAIVETCVRLLNELNQGE